MSNDFHDIIIQKASAQNLHKYIFLYRTCFPVASHFNFNYLNWLYTKNPEGSFFGIDAVVGEKVVGQVVTIPCRYILRGEPTKALLSINTSVHPQYRGRYLFKYLGEKLFELAIKDGYRFIIGSANAASTPGFIRHLGFQLVKPLDAVIGAGTFGVKDYAYILSHAEIRHDWTSETLLWRCQNPVNTVYLHDSGHFMAALASTGKFGVQAYAELPCMDLPNTLPIKRNYQSSFFLPRVFLGLIPGYKNSMNYIQIPLRFRPSPLNLIYKNLQDSTDYISPDACFINFLDFDAF